MTRRQIDSSREVRLWIRDVIVPTTVGVAVVMSNPSVRIAVKKKVCGVKNAVLKKFKKDRA